MSASKAIIVLIGMVMIGVIGYHYFIPLLSTDDLTYNNADIMPQVSGASTIDPNTIRRNNPCWHRDGKGKAVRLKTSFYPDTYPLQKTWNCIGLYTCCHQHCQDLCDKNSIGGTCRANTATDSTFSAQTKTRYTCRCPDIKGTYDPYCVQ